MCATKQGQAIGASATGELTSAGAGRRPWARAFTDTRPSVASLRTRSMSSKGVSVWFQPV